MKAFLLFLLLTPCFAETKTLDLAIEAPEKTIPLDQIQSSLSSHQKTKIQQYTPAQGILTLNYDDRETTPAALQKSLAQIGLKVVGHRLTLSLQGLFCQSCANHLTQVLGQTPGLLVIESLSYLNGQATLVFDPQKTSRPKIIAAIHSTPYRVLEPSKK